MSELDPKPIDIPDHEVLDSKVNEGDVMFSLRQAAIQALLEDGAISAEDLETHRRINGLIERRYRGALRKIGYTVVQSRMVNLEVLEKTNRENRERFGENAWVNIFTPEDSLDFCLRVYRSVNFSMIGLQGERIVPKTLQDLASVSDMSKKIPWQRKRLIQEAQERARNILAIREELMY